MWSVWLLAGFLICFVFNRIGDASCKKAGRNCRYDCDKCATHCTGYHCYKMRQEIAETSKRDGDTVDGGINEVSDV